MRKLFAVGAIALIVSGCVDFEDIGTACAYEATAHTAYLTFIAPFRPAEKVEKAQKFHANVQLLCEQGATLARINAARKLAAEARE